MARRRVGSQRLPLADEHPGEKARIVACTGMCVKKARGPSQPTFEAEPLLVSRAVHLFVCSANSRASYDAQCSKGEGRWVFGPGTVRIGVKLDGLERGSVCFFRYRTLTKEGVSEERQVVRLLVVRGFP